MMKGKNRTNLILRSRWDSALSNDSIERLIAQCKVEGKMPRVRSTMRYIAKSSLLLMISCMGVPESTTSLCKERTEDEEPVLSQQIV